MTTVCSSCVLLDTVGRWRIRTRPCRNPRADRVHQILSPLPNFPSRHGPLIVPLLDRRPTHRLQNQACWKGRDASDAVCCGQRCFAKRDKISYSSIPNLPLGSFPATPVASNDPIPDLVNHCLHSWAHLAGGCNVARRSAMRWPA